jgi:hypothetical protein
MKITKKVASKVLEIVDLGLCKGVGVPIPGQMCVEAAVCYALGEPHGDEPSCVDKKVRSFKISLNDSNWSTNEIRAKGMRRIAIAQLGTNDEKFDSVAFVLALQELAIKKWTPFALRQAAEVQQDPYKSNMISAAARCEAEGTPAAANAAYAAANAAYDAANAAYDAANAANAAYAAANAANAAANAEYAAVNAAYAAANAAIAAANAEYAAANAAYDAANAAYDAASLTRDNFLAECAEDVVQVLIKLKAKGTKFLSLTEASQQ